MVKGDLMKKNKKIKIIILISSIILISAISIGIYIKKEQDYKNLMAEIKSHYNLDIVVIKDTFLYDKNKKEIGRVEKGLKFRLKKEKIEDTSKTYFKIKGTNYYLFYKDVKPSDLKKMDVVNDKYLIFNNNIKTNDKTKFYYNDKLVMKINEEVSLPILYMDDNYYYVSYLNYIFQVKKDDSLKVIDNQNTTSNEASYVSVLHYEKIYNNEKCLENTCISLNKVKNHLAYLKEKGYYTITLDEYKQFLDKKIRLKEKAILVTTSTNNETVVNLNNESDYKIEVVDDNMGLKFNNSNKKSTKDSNKESINRYIIKNTTSDNDFQKMVAGEEVKEIVVVKKTNEQEIAVLNYHFFYDSSIGESCNESICLDVSVFRKHLDYLKDNGYKTLTISEFKRWMYNEIELPKKSVLITIDDGAMGTGKHNGNKLIPILEEYNMNATLFLISGWWDVSNYRSNNLDIQSHTFDMHNYGSCGKGQVVCSTHDQLLEDLKKSLTIVDNNDSFCFPFYSYNQSAIATVKEAGFKLAFVGGSRKAKRSDNKYTIPRYPIHKSHSMQQFINMVS